MLRLLVGALLASGVTGAAAQPPPSGASAWMPEVERAPAQRRPSAPAAPAGTATSAITAAGERTTLTVGVSRSVPITVRRMSSPYRIIVDLPEVEFRVPPGAGGRGKGVVKAFRYGLMAPGRSRIVIDIEGPARLVSADIRTAPESTASELTMIFEPVSQAEFRAGEIAEAARGFEPKPESTAAPPVPEKPESARPRIVIDPGHGGVDPGASGALAAEKTVVLEVALALRRLLTATGNYDITMTRDSDVFVALDRRIAISKQAHADLFVSIHADSLADKELAGTIRGATIYTLSERASDALANALAVKENAADALAGIDTLPTEPDDEVMSILADLLRRESANLSTAFRGHLVAQLKSRIKLARAPARAAPFKVLRQPGSPAVLIELGYMSNSEDERQMLDPAWQKKMAEGMARAIDGHFKKLRSGRR